MIQSESSDATYSISPILATLSLVVFCILENGFVAYINSGQSLFVRVLTDTTIHFIIGAWCWAIVVGIDSKLKWTEILTCGTMSSLIDIDHFIEAGSFQLKDLTNLHRRPFLHAVFSIPASCMITFISSQIFWYLVGDSLESLKMYKSYIFKLPLMLFVAWSSHQLRDSIRRGLWLWPFGETKPLSHWLYVMLVSTIPNLVRICIECCAEKKPGGVIEVFFRLKHGLIFILLILLLLLLGEYFYQKYHFWHKILPKGLKNLKIHQYGKFLVNKMGGNCPETPPDLKHRETSLNTNYSNIPSFEEIIATNPEISEGGQYSPTCKARHRVAIIIPLRGRELQLRGLLTHMHPIWQRQQIDYTVYTITQAGRQLFNRAKLMNVGFAEASKDRDYDCFVFHDVDILLENDACLYWCHGNHSEVRHISAYLEKYGYKLRQYESKCLPDEYPMKVIVNFGGITMMSGEQFRDLNGFSNIYWGWGGEDDDMALRVWRKGYNVVRNESCRFRMFDHEREERNGLKNRIRNSGLRRQDKEGLNTLSYSLLSVHRSQLHTNITVDVGSPREEMLRMNQDKEERRSCDGDVFVDEFWWRR